MRQGCCVYGKWEDLGIKDRIKDFVPANKAYHAIDGIWYLWINKLGLSDRHPNSLFSNVNLCEEHHYQCLLESLGKSADLSI